MARRGENIYKRKDGRWEGRYMKGHNRGKAVYGYVYAKKYSECREKLIYKKSQYAQIKKPVKTCGNGILSDYMWYWLSDIAKPYIKTSTFSNYVAMVEKWIVPLLGKKKLEYLEKEDIQHFIGILTEHELSPGTIRNIYQVLSSSMKKAKEYSYIYDNPCEGISLPKEQKKESRILSQREQKQLQAAIRGDQSELPILLASYTGLRIGEICALTWEDVDLENGIIHVTRTTQRIQCKAPDAQAKTELITGSAKSDCSARTIPLPAGLLQLFQKYRESAYDGFVFGHRGNPLEPRVLQYRFKALLKKAGLEDINFHALRHTFATRCMELSIDVKTLSELLGHASAKMTLDRYGHSQVEQKKMAMLALDQLFACSI